MRAKTKTSSTPYLILIGVILLIVIVLYFFFKTENLKSRKDDLEAEFQQLKEQIKEKEQSVEFLTAELNRLKFIKGCIIDYAIWLYTIIKLILLVVVVGVSIILYALFNFDLITSLGVILPVLTFGYYGITIVLKNRIGDFNRALKLIQEYFINIVLKLKRFDISLIEILETKMFQEIEELKELQQKCSVYELKTAAITSL